MSYINGPRISTEGLVCMLDAANKKSYSGTGANWFDLSGMSNTGSIAAPTFTSSFGGAFMFTSGSSDYVSTGLIPNLASGSVSIWFRLASLRDYNTLFDNSIGANDWECWVYVSGTARFRTNAANDDIMVSTTTTLSAGVVYNIVVTWSPNNGAIYLNGVLNEFDTALGTRTAPSSFSIGGGNAGNSKMHGEIFQVSVYNRSLSATEILNNYIATGGRFR